jgi:hypothetical protein
LGIDVMVCHVLEERVGIFIVEALTLGFEAPREEQGVRGLVCGKDVGAGSRGEGLHMS